VSEVTLQIKILTRLPAALYLTADRYKKKRQTDGAAASTVNRELASPSHLFLPPSGNGSIGHAARGC
jgi:hypothetical protein